MKKQIKKQKRTLKGEVVSDKMDKTIVVKVSGLKLHPKYKRHYKISRRFKVLDEKNQYHVGDKVKIEETRPLSKEKRWRVISFASLSQNQNAKIKSQNDKLKSKSF